MRPRSSTSSALLAAMLLLCPASGRAAAPDHCQEDAVCKEQTEKAAQLAGQTKYQEALALYQSAYDRVHEPRLLMNLGRCLFRLGRARKALELYTSFQKAEPDPDPSLAARVQQFIDEAKQAVETDNGGPGPAETPGATTTTATLLVPPNPPEEEPPPAVTPAPSSGRLVLGGRPLYRVALGGVVLGLGLASLGLGVGALAANGSCASASESSPGQCAIMYQSGGPPFTSVLDGLTPGIPLLLAGVALSAGGIALIAVPPRKPAREAARPK